MNPFHYNQDPIATDTLLEDARTLIITAKLDENVDNIKSIVSTIKVGDSTNFGKVVEIGANSITFKAKDLPKTTIPFIARKMGSKDYVLDKLIKLKEETLKEAIMQKQALKEILRVMETQSFADWYEKDFTDYIEGDPSGKTQEKILDDLNDFFN
jgi:tRNA uridine 5-carbamoylmethylation protein Kti12